MLEAGVENFFDAAQLGRPGAPHFVKTGIYVGAQVIDVGIYVAQARIIDQIPPAPSAWWEPRLARSIKFGPD
jgi:hypothetical protein